MNSTILFSLLFNHENWYILVQNFYDLPKQFCIGKNQVKTDGNLHVPDKFFLRVFQSFSSSHLVCLFKLCFLVTLGVPGLGARCRGGERHRGYMGVSKSVLLSSVMFYLKIKVLLKKRNRKPLIC